MRFYFEKIGEHLQELAVLAMVFIPLDKQALDRREMMFIYPIFGAMLIVGIELERRYR